ncbi:serine/threonine protein kinase, partial [Streptomyces sp. MTZ3.1]|nr:serine/threonine protein kinase [Streptomyces meridianus]
ARNGAAAAGVSASASGAAADRARSALRSVRNASAAHRAEADAPAPATPAGPRSAGFTDRVSRRVLAVVAVVVLALVGSVLAYNAMSGDGGGGKQAPAASGESDTADGSKDKEQGGDKGTGTDNSASPSASPSASADDEKDGDDKDKDSSGSGGGKDELPDGYRIVTNSQFNFAIAMPKGWKRTGTAGQNSGAIYSKNGGYPRMQVDFTASPGEDAKAAWESADRGAAAGSISGYRLIGIKKVPYRGYPTVADWEFERRPDSERMRVLNRGFRVNSTHGYAIMITCAKDAWDDKECRTLRDTAFRTFRVKD